MGPMTRREWVAGAFATGLASCVPKTSRSQDTSTITVLYRGEDETCLGPAEQMPAMFLVFMPLAVWNKHGELEGALAERWEHSPDFRTWTIHLRDGIRWHDGAPVTAHDMKFTLDLLQHSDVLQIAPESYTVSVLSDLTYTITHHRQGLFDAVDSYMPCWPKHLLEKLDPKEFESWDFWKHPVGCGPYRHVRNVPKTMMEFEANPNYFRGKPKIAKVILKFGDGSAMPELLSRNVDAVCYPYRSDVMNISRYRRFRAHQQTLNSGRAIYWNTRHPFFQDAAVRRALTYAINRSELLQVLNLPSNVQPIDFLRTSLQVRRGDFPESNPYDPVLAAHLLHEAGWTRRGAKGLIERGGELFRFKAFVLNTLAGLSDAAVYAQDQLKRIGVLMDLVMISDGGLLQSRIERGDFEAVITGLGDWKLDAFIRATGYNNPFFFKLLDRMRSTFDPEEKERLHAEMTIIFRADVPLTFLFPFAVTTIASTRVRGLDNFPYSGDLTLRMEELWLEEA